MATRLIYIVLLVACIAVTTRWLIRISATRQAVLLTVAILGTASAVLIVANKTLTGVVLFAVDLAVALLTVPLVMLACSKGE